MPEIGEGSLLFDEVKKWGGSCILVITPDDMEYLGVKEGSKIVKKYDKGKHGRFIGLGKRKE